METVDPHSSVARQWRKDERTRLIEARLAVSADERKEIAARIAKVLNEIVPAAPDTIVSLYWPFRGELDFRDWMKDMHERGAHIALPLVVANRQPLAFREWTPGCTMERGVWNIPIPANGPKITPNYVIAPVVGFDAKCYRLGYGGGFYDRTIAALPRPQKVIGVGLSLVEIKTIHPHEHDIPMDMILTGDSVREPV